MISTKEEFLLLLKKWQNEETKVSFVMTYQEPQHLAKVTLHMQGVVGQVFEEQSEFILGGDANMVYINFADCSFIYESDPDVVGLQRVTGEKYEDVAMLVTPSKLKIAIYTVRATLET